MFDSSKHPEITSLYILSKINHMCKFRKCPQTLEKMNDNYRIHWPNLIQGKVIRNTADLLHDMN